MDMVVRLLGEGKSFAGTMEAGGKSVWQLNSAMDKLTASMEREQAGSKQSSRQTEILALADKGASAAKVGYALALASELDSRDELAAGILREADALRQKKIAEAENAAWIEKTITVEQQRTSGLGVSAVHLKMQEMAQRGATAAETDAYYTAVQASQKQDQLTAAMDKKNAALHRSSQGLAGHSNSTTRNMMAIQALAFGVQDAAQVYGNTGLAGALSASANNLIFMTSMLSPQLAIFTAIGVAAGQFAAVLLPMATNSKAMAEEAERFNKAMEEEVDWFHKGAAAAREFQHAMEDAKDRTSAKSLLGSKQREGQDLAATIREHEQTLESLAQKRKAVQERAGEQMAGATGFGMMGRATGMLQTPGVIETKAIDDLMRKKQGELSSLRRQEALNKAQLPLAQQNANAADAEQRMAESDANRLKRRDEQQAAESKLTEQQNELARKGHEQFVKDKQTLEQKLTLQTVDDERAARLKVIQEMGERQQQIDKWLNDGRITAAEQTQLTFQNRQAGGRSIQELDDKQKAKDGKDAAGLLEKQLKKDKEKFKNQTDDSKGGHDLKAVEANSSEAFKRVFDATMGGGEANNPNRQIAENTHRMKEYMRLQLEKAELQLEETKKLKPMKTGPA